MVGGPEHTMLAVTAAYGIEATKTWRGLSAAPEPVAWRTTTTITHISSP